MNPHIRVSVTDGVGSIVIDRPDAMNAVSREMAEALSDAVFAHERDPAVRALLIRGEGPNFTAGGDVKGFHDGLTTDRAAHAASLEKRVAIGHLSMHRIRRMAKPVVVAAQGTTAGLGVSLICCADFALAADDSVFTLAYRHIGLSVDGGVSYFLPRIVGERRALEIALLGERFTAAQAYEWGLLNRLHPADTLQDEAEKFARQLARGPTAALGAIKGLMRSSQDHGWDQQSALEARTISQIAASDDHLEGVAAFVEKRRATFTGR